MNIQIDCQEFPNEIERDAYKDGARSALNRCPRQNPWGNLPGVIAAHNAWFQGYDDANAAFLKVLGAFGLR